MTFSLLRAPLCPLGPFYWSDSLISHSVGKIRTYLHYTHRVQRLPFTHCTFHLVVKGNATVKYIAVNVLLRFFFSFWTLKPQFTLMQTILWSSTSPKLPKFHKHKGKYSSHGTAKLCLLWFISHTQGFYGWTNVWLLSWHNWAKRMTHSWTGETIAPADASDIWIQCFALS